MMMQPHIKDSLDEYARTGRQLGHFLTAVLSNDLFEAFGRADEKNVATMKYIVMYIYNELPCTCHGSKEKVEKWQEAGGLEGKEK